MKKIFLLKYTYPTDGNLGDHIQILGMTEILKKLDIKVAGYVDRESPTPVAKNANLLLSGYLRVPDLINDNLSKANTIFSNIHLHKDPNDSEDDISKAIARLSEDQPILCRDKGTLELLKKRGITNASFNYCPSLCFARRRREPASGKIFVEDELLKLTYLPHELRKQKVYEVSHLDFSSSSFSDKLKKAQKLLDTYKNEAKLVITTRLHAALPCIAMGVPVVLFHHPYDKHLHRMALAKEFIPVHRIEQQASRTERYKSKILHALRISDSMKMEDINYSPMVLDIEDKKKHIIKSIEEIIKLKAI